MAYLGMTAGRNSSQYLRRVSDQKIDNEAVPCVALSHNEMSILQDFLNHYRALGSVTFAIVDDRSDDGTRAFLLEQPDVTVFEPVEGSTYSEHKREWRSELLNAFADGRWCLAPDIDEHLVYRDHENRPLNSLITDLETEGAGAFHCTMLDMYADKPLTAHSYRGDGIAKAFPLTDGPDAYMMLPAPSRFRQKYPTPYAFVYGGMRDRLFFRPTREPSALQTALIRRYGRLDGPFNPGLFRRAAAWATRRICKSLRPKEPFICTKLTLIKWTKGQQFSGGSHAVALPLHLSEQSGGLLHYKFVKGVSGIEYTAARGQHAGGSVIYKRVLEQREKMSSSPVYSGTQRYEGSASLDWILR